MIKWRILEEEKPEPERTLFVLSETHGYQVDMLERSSPNLPYRLGVPAVIWWIYTSEINKPPKTLGDSEGLGGCNE